MEANQSLNTQVRELGGTDISLAHPVLTSFWALSPTPGPANLPAIHSLPLSNQLPALHQAQLSHRYHVQPLQIESQAHQDPLARCSGHPSSENCRKPSTSLMIPITGSTVHFRNR